MYKRGLSLLAGGVVLALVGLYWAPRLTAALPQTRTISLYNIHTKETVTVQYKKDGKYVPEAMDQINWILRDWRKNEKTRMDPELIDLLWEVHTELGSREPIHIISGYRSRSTNEMLRATRGGQASQSRHILGKAADVHFPDVPIRRIRYSALVRERGGVGYYPTSAIPFVHLDTDRVRAWPRLPRYELALLFPDGRTQHIPADGRPLSREDVHIARAQHKDLAMQVAAYQELRMAAQSPTRLARADAGVSSWASPAPQQRVALASPRPESASQPARAAAGVPSEPMPKLVAAPQLVQRPAQVASRTSDEDRMKLAQLAALASLPEPGPKLVPASLGADEPLEATPKSRLAALDPREANPGPNATPQGRFGWGAGWGNGSEDETSWVAAPAYDDEHPEELSYRPFPIIPYLTETPSPDDPALARMEHPDVAKTLELLDQAGELPPMQLRPEPQRVQLLWAQHFQGEAVPLAKVFGERPPPTPSGLAERAVRVSSR